MLALPPAIYDVATSLPAVPFALFVTLGVLASAATALAVAASVAAVYTVAVEHVWPALRDMATAPRRTLSASAAMALLAVWLTGLPARADDIPPPSAVATAPAAPLVSPAPVASITQGTPVAPAKPSPLAADLHAAGALLAAHPEFWAPLALWLLANLTNAVSRHSGPATPFVLALLNALTDRVAVLSKSNAPGTLKVPLAASKPLDAPPPPAST